MKRRVVFFLFCTLIFGCLLPTSSCKKQEKVGCRYEIKAEYVPENQSLCATQKVEYKNLTQECIEHLDFNLYPNAFRKESAYCPVPAAEKSAAYYAGESYGEINVTSVVGGKSWEITGVDKNLLRVYLETPLYPEDSIVLDVSFITVLASINHRTGVGERTVNLGNFYPVLCAYSNGFYECAYFGEGDPFVSECADYVVHLTVPKEYVAVASGALIEESLLESKKVCSVEVLSSRDFAVVLSKEFFVREEKVCGKLLSYYGLQGETPEQTEKAFGALKESFAFFNEQFGEYAYSTFSLVRVSMAAAGAEYPALSMLSVNEQAENEIKTVVHETAHQWWYAAVGSNQIENAWQDEGLAEYSTVLFFESHGDYGYSREELVQASLTEYRSYFSTYAALEKETNTKMRKPIAEFASGYEYRAVAYDKSVVMYDFLRSGVGEKRFFAGLSRYYAEHKFRLTTPEDLIGCFEKAGADVAGFFESFLEGKVIL
ncbi:MAG: M1 family metallopeptidase [Clostridia bacterium]|nr:M1 family metallopeptidase [Clostridia bacterium]